MRESLGGTPCDLGLVRREWTLRIISRAEGTIEVEPGPKPATAKAPTDWIGRHVVVFP